jgi:cytochrome c oxidase assembly factor CtaG
MVAFVVLLAYAIPYGVRARTLARRGRPVPTWRLWCFGIGLLLLAVATSSPVLDEAGSTLAAHMAEHLVIADWEKPDHWMGDSVALDTENGLFKRISRAMTALLRFRAFREGLPIDRGGWMRVADVAKFVATHHVGEKLIMRVVRGNPTARFQ